MNLAPDAKFVERRVLNQTALATQHVKINSFYQEARRKSWGKIHLNAVLLDFT